MNITGLFASVGRPARWCIAIGAATWAGAAAPQTAGLARLSIIAICLVGLLVAISFSHQWWLIAFFIILGCVAGLVSSSRTDRGTDAGLPEGHHEVSFVISEEASSNSYGFAIGSLSRIDGHDVHAHVAIRGVDGEEVGTRIDGRADIINERRVIRGKEVRASLFMTALHGSTASRHPIVATGNAVRTAVVTAYPGDRRANALIGGFLIGYTDEMHSRDIENLRMSGLSHFTAVSGSNVALFLLLWWFVTAPLAVHRHLRVVAGLVGLWLFVIITRWEASVVRAAVMAAVPLVGGWMGVPVTPWMAMGVATTLLILSSPHLGMALGFQLSVLATAGVLTGLRAAASLRGPRWVVIPLATTLGAQAAVAPLLLATFGAVPLLSPLANLIAAPVVGATTAIGAVGVAVPPLRPIARVGAVIVLKVADLFDRGPQLGWVAAGAAAVIILLIVGRRTRPLGWALGAVALVVALGAAPVRWPIVPTLTVLDIGQGDAIVVQDPSGASLLIDGGSDPRRLDLALRRIGLPTPSAILVTHGDNDHVGGLTELIERSATGRLYVSTFSSDIPIVESAHAAGVEVVLLRAGDRVMVGGTSLLILSPGRRYLSDNDGSIVAFVETPRTVLLPGDAETTALRELPDVSPDVLVVPHHGSGSTDRGWLAGVEPQMAILSYGPNRYGHPHPEIVAIVEQTADVVMSTADDGDIRVPLIHGR